MKRVAWTLGPGVVWGVMACVLGWGSAARAQDLTRRPPPEQAQAVAIVNATLHGPDGAPAEGGAIVFEKGRIVAVGSGATAPRPPAGARVIDAKGRRVYPGLIAPYTQTGLQEIEAVRASTDINEVGAEGVSPEAVALVSVNPDSTIIPVTRRNGVLLAGVFPEGGPVPGRASVIRLEGWTYEDMRVKRDAGLVVSWPWMRPVRAWWMDQSEEDQKKEIERSLRVIEGAFESARAYLAARRADPSLPADLRWESMRGVLEAPEGGEKLPVFFDANEYDQIVAALAFAQRHALRAVIVGGRDAGMCADLLKERDVPVMIMGTFRFPKRDDSAYDEAFTLPARLEAAGVRWCLATNERTSNERNLPYAAALAVAYGLDRAAAVRGITLSAAEILGVGDRVGSLEVGKEATLFIADGDVLEVTTNVDAAFIAGREIDLSSKQTELEAKYREKYRQLGVER